MLAREFREIAGLADLLDALAEVGVEEGVVEALGVLAYGEEHDTIIEDFFDVEELLKGGAGIDPAEGL
jgi:hypothetical protein